MGNEQGQLLGQEQKGWTAKIHGRDLKGPKRVAGVWRGAWGEGGTRAKLEFVAFVEKGNSKEIYIKRLCSQEGWLRRLQKQKINTDPCSLSSVTRGHQ